MNKVILLVDDNPSDIYLTRRTLKIHNIAHEIVVANDGQEALDYLFGTGQYAGRDLRQMPTVILLDMRMPGMDGLDVLRRIRNNQLTRDLPVIVFTVDEEDSDKVSSLVEGPNAYIRKPLDLDQFYKAVIQLGISSLVPGGLPPKSKDQ
jgi:two-component system, response regulator